MKSNPNDTKPLNLLQTIFGLALRPFATVDRLFLNPNAWHTLLILGLLLLTILTPVFASYQTHGRWLYDWVAVLSLLLVTILTFLFFLLIEQAFLKFLKIEVSLQNLIHIVSYCVVPLIVTIWCLYAYNIFDSGQLTFVSFMIAGVPRRAEPLIEHVPFFINVGIVGCFLVFYRALKTLNSMYAANAFFIAIVSMIPFHIALLLAIITANQIHPGTTDVFIRLIYAPDTLMQ